MPLPRLPPPPPPSFLGSAGFVTGEAGSLECGCVWVTHGREIRALEKALPAAELWALLRH